VEQARHGRDPGHRRTDALRIDHGRPAQIVESNGEQADPGRERANRPAEEIP